MADITGAFIAGLIVSASPFREYLVEKFDTLSSLHLSPLFFASIGISIVVPKMNANILLFAVALTIVAVLTKVLGCYLGAVFMNYSNKEALQIGIGMISRGEVALIVAHKGQSLGLIKPELLGPIVVVVIAATILAPVFLKISFTDKIGG